MNGFIGQLIESPKSFGGVSKDVGKIIPLNFSGSREEIICISKLEFINSNSYIGVGARQSYGPISVALFDGYALKPIRFSGNSIEIDELSSTVFVDANITIALLNNQLIKKGYSLLVVPGAEYSTIGGCIAADVHGKNCHKYGSFGDHVIGLSLFDVRLGRATWINSNDSTYKWTVGGFGVTGVILTAHIKVIKQRGKSMLLNTIRYKSPHELVKDLVLYSHDTDDIGAWFSPIGSNFRGKIFLANWTNKTPRNKVSLHPFLTRSIFYLLGQKIWRKYSSRFLALYIYLRHDPSYPQIPNNILFPLSTIVGWNNFFGSSFIERQFLVPIDHGVYAIDFILDLLRLHNVNTPLCAMKLFKGKRRGIMSFANEGFSFSIQYEAKHYKLDQQISLFLKKNSYPEYLAKIQPTSVSFPSGYFEFQSWLNLAKNNNINSVMIEWLRNNMCNYS